LPTESDDNQTQEIQKEMRRKDTDPKTEPAEPKGG
jgi:hypothetical protein